MSFEPARLVLAVLAGFATGCSAAPVAPPLAPLVPGGRVHAPRSESGARIVLEIAASDFRSGDSEFVRWCERAVAAIEAYYGRFPLAAARITVRSRAGRRVLFGQASASGIEMLVGRDAGRAAFDRDWMLVHEMVHLAMPNLPSEHRWLEEGSATYVEPIARASAGQRTAEQVWREIVRDYGQGLPEAGDQGLDRTPTWARTYYGGALWCLVADVELRKASGNRVGLRAAFAHAVARGGTIAAHWPLERYLSAADEVAGGRTLRDLHARHALTPVAVDLEALWRELGVRLLDGRVEFDDGAPLAAIRRAMVPER